MRNEVLGGRYRILERIGEGGMAFVYVAMDEKLGRKVAIKVLHEHMQRNQDIRNRFQQEAHAISGLDHPNIVKIYDFSGSQSERLWIVTEVIDGQNLAQFVQQFTGGWLHPIVAAAIVREICKALDKAHSHGIVHRDIKPENIMLTGEGRVKLMDFGIAKDLGKSSMTLTGTFMGSPSYMSPEQIRGRDVDLRSDLYSLSVLFYEIVTGRLPFTGQTTHDVIMKIMEGGFTHPRFIVPTIPDAANNTIVLGMSKDPKNRQQSAHEYGNQIETFLTAMKFDESHIELERYFRDRKAYEQRLQEKRPNMLNTVKLPSQPQATLGVRLKQTRNIPPAPLPVTRDRISHSRRETTYGEPRKTSARSPFHVDDTWQKHIPAAPTAGPSQQSATAVRSQHSIYQRQQVAAAAEMRRQAAYGVARAAPKVRRSVNKNMQIRRMNPIRRIGFLIPFKQSFLSQVFGVMLVGLIGIICAYGFWELQTKLQPTATRTLNRTKVMPRPPKPTNDTRIFKKSLPPKVAPTVRNTTAKNPNIQGQNRPQYATSSQSRKNKSKSKKLTKRAQVAPAVKTEVTSDANVQIETVEVKKFKRKAATLPANSSTAQPETEAASESANNTPTNKVSTAKGLAKVSFSAQPAAEIYLDGKRSGTTIDATTSSGWLELSAGEHNYELRRQGHETLRGKVFLEAGEQRQISKTMPPAQSSENDQNAAATPCFLTIRVNQLPAQVTIRGGTGSSSQVFTLKTPVKTIELPPGRYQVKVEYQGQLKEREIIFATSVDAPKKLTFSADFKSE